MSAAASRAGFLRLLLEELDLDLADSQLDVALEELESWDSRHMLRLVAALERDSGTPVPVSSLLEARTMEQIRLCAAEARKHRRSPMAAQGNSTTGPRLRDPIEVRGAISDWGRLRTDLADTGTALLIAKLADWAPSQADGPSLRELLGRDWSRYLDIAHPDIRLRFAASRSLLKHAAGAALHGDPRELELSYGPTGRPYLRGFDQLDISLSHTKDLLLVGLTSLGLIGVDAELADRQLYQKGMGRHVCTSYEMVMLANLPAEDRNPALLRLWTLKEAYSKAIGQGMQFRFTEFGFGPDGKPIRVHRPDGTPGTGAEWGFRTFALDSGYCVSAAVYDAGFGRALDTRLMTMLDVETVEALTTELRNRDDPGARGSGAD